MTKNNKLLFASIIGGFLLFRLLKNKSMSSFKNKLIELANNEWKKWNIPTKVKEGSTKTIQDLRNYYKIGTNNNWSDAKMISTAWSGTFISYLMRMAGAGKNFFYSTLHADYIQKAKKNRINNIKTFQAYKPDEISVEAGDLICYPRQEGVTYETNGVYFAHCDIVTKIENNKATAIGGNVSNSVSKSIYELDDNNKVKTSKVHVVIKNLL